MALPLDLGVVFSANGNGIGSYTDKNGATRSNATLVNGSWVAMNTVTIPTALVHAGSAGSLTAFVYYNESGAGATSVDFRLRQKYGGSDADVSSAYAAITIYDNANKANTNEANITASGVYRYDTTNARNGGPLIAEIRVNGGLANADAVKVALVAGGA